MIFQKSQSQKAKQAANSAELLVGSVGSGDLTDVELSVVVGGLAQAYTIMAGLNVVIQSLGSNEL